MKRISILIALIFSSSSLFAQSLEERENRLVELLGNLRAAESLKDKNDANVAFKSYLEETIQQEGAFDYPFDRLTTLGSIKSPDNILRLFNWNVEQDDLQQKYYCYILKYNDRKKQYDLSELIDNSFMIPARPTETLEANQWYGALYYRIIPIDKGSKKVYTLIGWDGNNSLSSIKLMDVLYFSGNSPKLGLPVFKTEDETKRRVFYEHSKKTTMYMNYEEDRKRIIMDHLSPETPSMKGIYSFYVPDLSYDAYVLENNKWTLKEDVIGVNDATPDVVTIQYRDEKTGKMVEKNMKATWDDPSDPNAPAGGSTHVATTPEDQEVDSNSKKEKDKKEQFKNQPKSNIGAPTKRRKRK